MVSDLIIKIFINKIKIKYNYPDLIQIAERENFLLNISVIFKLQYVKKGAEKTSME